MNIEMQRLLLKEIKEELSDIDIILNEDCCRVDNYTADKLSKIHSILTMTDKIQKIYEEIKKRYEYWKKRI